MSSTLFHRGIPDVEEEGVGSSSDASQIKPRVGFVPPPRGLKSLSHTQAVFLTAVQRGACAAACLCAAGSNTKICTVFSSRRCELQLGLICPEHLSGLKALEAKPDIAPATGTNAEGTACQQAAGCQPCACVGADILRTHRGRAGPCKGVTLALCGVNASSRNRETSVERNGP